MLVYRAQTDISQVVIDHMRELHQQYSNMTYVVSDCRNMPEFLDCQFGSVLDKGKLRNCVNGHVSSTAFSEAVADHDVDQLWV